MRNFDDILLAIVRGDDAGTTRQLFNMLPVGISLYNKKGVLVAVNKCEMDFMGVSNKAYILGANIFYDTTFAPELQERIGSEDEFSLWHYYDYGRIQGVTSSNKRGRIRVFTRFKKLRDKEGNVQGYVLINMDDKGMNSEKNSRFQPAMSDISGTMDIQVVYDEHHEIIGMIAHNVEPQAAALLGKNCSQLEGENIFRQSIYIPYCKEIAAMKEEHSRYTFYYYALHSRKYLRWSFIYRNANTFSCRLVDITSHLMDIQGISFSELFFRNMFDKSPVAIVFTDTNKRVEDVNAAFLKMTGITDKQKIIGRIFPRKSKGVDSLNIIPPDVDEYEMDDVYKVERDVYNEIGVDELFLRVKVQKFYLPDGVFRGYIYYLIDLTRNKTYEEKLKAQKDKAQEKSDMKSRFLQNMSHDIRTPLNAIVGFSQLLGLPDGSLTPEEKEEYSDHIVNNSNMLMMLVDDILNISDVENGNYKITCRAVKCNELCANTLKSVEYRVPAGVKLYYTTDVGDDETIFTDGRRVQQVLINFLTNACKHTAEGEIHLECRVHEKEGMIHFSVTDTGEGIDPALSDNLFARFSKLTTVEGTGLGLNICRTVAKNLGGSVSYDKSYTDGAKFDFYIPAKPLEEK